MISGLKLNRASGVPFYRQLFDQIADRIHGGVLRPGDALPSIRELAASLVVSVITVKGAYEALEADGLIVSQQGKGTFVKEGVAAVSSAKLTKEISEELERAARRAQAARMSEARVQEIAREAIHRVYRKEK